MTVARTSTAARRRASSTIGMVGLVAAALSVALGLVFGAHRNWGLQSAPPERSAGPNQLQPLLVETSALPASHAVPVSAVPEQNGAGTDSASVGAIGGSRELPACAGQRLLDIEPGPDGGLRGAWLESGARGPTLVLLGERFAGSTLMRVSADEDQRTLQAWLSTPDGPCLSTLQAAPASTAVSAERARAAEAFDAEAQPVRQRNPARQGPASGVIQGRATRS